MTAGFVVLLLGVALGTVLFVWFRSVEHNYAHAEVQRRCGSLADALKLDFDTNLNTYLIDFAGYMATAGAMTNATMDTFARNASSQSDRLFAVQLGPLVPAPDSDAYRRRFHLPIVQPPPSALMLTSIPITLRLGYVLTRKDLPDSLVPDPRERIYIFAGIRNAVDPDFSMWVLVASVKSQSIFASDFSRVTVGELTVELHDQDTALLLYSVVNASPTLGDPVRVAIHIVDRTWVVSCTSTAAHRASFATPWPVVLLVLVLAIASVAAELVRRGLLRLLTARSVEHHVQQQAALVRAIRHYSTGILRAVRDPLIALDGHGYIVGLNDAAFEKLGLAGEPGLGRAHVRGVVHTVASPLTTLAPGTYEVGPVGHPDRSFFAEVTASEVTSSKRDELAQVLILHDVSERIWLLDENQDTEAAANRASGIKEHLLHAWIHGGAHDFDGCSCTLRRAVNIATFVAVYGARPGSAIDLELGFAASTATAASTVLALTTLGALLQSSGGSILQFDHPDRRGINFVLPLQRRPGQLEQAKVPPQSDNNEHAATATASRLRLGQFGDSGTGARSSLDERIASGSQHAGAADADLNGNAPPGERERCVEAGLNTSLAKPLERPVLCEVRVEMGSL
ncbi:hypothetical protein H9P43_002747 [Blastocladiella emersonii ATCC 22665]|nr:hypothetical protein H9P43_002747 [Blastocladiella emersonii ATCC 22665]